VDAAGKVGAYVYFLGQIFVPTVTELTKDAGLDAPVLQDLKVGSAKLDSLNAATGDAVPHANVYGRIGFHLAPMRMALSAANLDGSFEKAKRGRNIARSVFQTCEWIGYFAIYGLFTTTPCARADNAIGGMDQAWMLYTNGTKQEVPTFAGVIKVPYEYPFDGLFPNRNSKYPGLSDPSLDLLADGANHMNIQDHSKGRIQMIEAMRGIRMRMR
jgi:hypothetical protein